jgi:hypothetical protein
MSKQKQITEQAVVEVVPQIVNLLPYEVNVYINGKLETIDKGENALPYPQPTPIKVGNVAGIQLVKLSVPRPEDLGIEFINGVTYIVDRLYAQSWVKAGCLPEDSTICFPEAIYKSKDGKFIARHIIAC